MRYLLAGCPGNIEDVFGMVAESTDTTGVGYRERKKEILVIVAAGGDRGGFPTSACPPQEGLPAMVHLVAGGVG